MRFQQTFKDSLYWFKNLLVDLSTRRSLGYILIIALVVTFIAGLLLYIIDSNIHSPLDGIWSAWVTMTHVGFGDVVPTSFFGRLLAAALILFGLAVFSLFTASLSVVRRYPSQFDGRAVTVRGRVGDDVFAVGAGWAFYLMQGRDTIVTFTRTQAPRPHDVITVKGQVSTGFLDGVPRQALFEDIGKEQ